MKIYTSQRERRRMITEEDKAEFKEGVKRAGNKFTIALSANDQADFLFQPWSEAVHRIFIRHGCSCRHGSRLNCFGVLTREAKIALMEGNDLLSFENFLSLFDEARVLFLTGNWH
jgi:hypothetical protein